jgi:hypothetical protein
VTPSLTVESISKLPSPALPESLIVIVPAVFGAVYDWSVPVVTDEIGSRPAYWITLSPRATDPDCRPVAVYVTLV